MNGGRGAQLAFYYQNLFCIYVILDSLEDSIVKISIDCPLQELGINKKGEIDKDIIFLEESFADIDKGIVNMIGFIKKSFY